MLWILSGSHRSGKNIFKNLLVSKYGFKVVSKYVLEDTAGQTVNFFQNRRLVQIAKRDPSLIVVKPPDRRAQILEQLGKEQDKKQKSALIKNIQDEKIIYDKQYDKEEKKYHYYCIEVKDIVDAISDAHKAEHTLLVCSDPKIIEKIKRLDNTGERIKTVMLFGMHLSQEEESNKKGALAKAKNKIGEFFNASTRVSVDYVICNNIYFQSLKEIYANMIEQWEALTSRLDNSPQRLNAPEPTISDIGEVDSGIFFIKPFAKTVQQKNEERATKIYDAINTMVRSKAELFSVQKCYDDVNDIYYIGGDEPAHSVRYLETEQQIAQKDRQYPQKEMRDEIKKANLVIADVADCLNGTMVHNANCYWEIGYAKALNKDILLLVDEKALQYIPFDISDQMVYKYSFDENGFFMDDDTKERFEKKIELYFKQLKDAATERLNYITKMIECEILKN